MVNHRKVIYSLLKEIKSEPKAEDYGLETSEFGDIVDMMLDVDCQVNLTHVFI